MSTQTVYRITRGGGVDSLRATREPIPAPGRHEILVKIRGVGLNYRDLAIANGSYPLETLPEPVPCSDMAGEIVKLGEGVSESTWSRGDKVISILNLDTMYLPVLSLERSLGGPIDGVLQEYMVFPASALIKIPPSSPASFAEWASAVGVASTVWNTFYGGPQLKPGQTVLVLGTGGTSMAALVFAKAAGATTIVTSSNDDKLARVKATYGADHLINYRKTPDWDVEVQRITNGRGVDNVVEVGGSATMAKSIASVANGGVVTIIGFLNSASQEDMPDVAMLALVKSATLRGVLGGSKQQLEEAVTFIANRELPLPVDKTFGFEREQVLEALRYMEAGKMIGKVCISVG